MLLYSLCPECVAALHFQVKSQCIFIYMGSLTGSHCAQYFISISLQGKETKVRVAITQVTFTNIFFAIYLKSFIACSAFHSIHGKGFMLG